jgi:hypothetical protein
MTAEVLLESNPDLTREVVIDRSDVSHANHTYVRAGEKLTIDDLLHLMLVASDNAAARALARTSSLGREAFIDRMNGKAKELGLTQTTYADPSGLLSDNVASAYDMARLITLVSNDERVSSIMRMPYYTVLTNRRVFLVDAFHGNTNLADSVNHLLVVGFYLINIGYVTLALKYGDKPGTSQQAFEFLSTKVGLVLLILGGMHFFNVFNFAKIRRKSRHNGTTPAPAKVPAATLTVPPLAASNTPSLIFAPAFTSTTGAVMPPENSRWISKLACWA